MSLLSSVTSLFTILCVSLVTFSAKAQDLLEQRTVELLPSSGKVLDLQQGGLHALAATWESSTKKPSSIRYRYTQRDLRFTPWQDWSLTNEAGAPAAALLMLPGNVGRVEVQLEGKHRVQVSALTYRVSSAATAHRKALAARSCACPSPAVIDRSGWCPNGDCPVAGTPTAVTPQHVIIHHSATQLAGVDYALVVRAIYDYHTGTNGWDDIGYNVLIAPDGTVFEGRGIARQGAHFCGANAETLGVCMLGNYDAQRPSAAALSALTDVGAFLGCEFAIDPLAMQVHQPSGKTLNGVAGHRDGCSTDCPGSKLHAMLPNVRSNIATNLSEGCQALAAPQNLAASSAGNGAVDLDWTRYSGATLIIVERASSHAPEAFTTIAEVDGDAHRYTDRSAPAGSVRYRLRAMVNGRLSDGSNEAELTVSSAASVAAHIKPRLARNPVRGNLEVLGLEAPVDMAFVSDAAGRSVLELQGADPRWQIQAGKLAHGRYWLMLFSGYEWFTIPFEYRG